MLKKFMQQMFSFFQDDFAKSEIGHYFCPFFSFPKQSWKNKNTKLYNKWIYLLKGIITFPPRLFYFEVADKF
jgi:hypothetical protein